MITRIYTENPNEKEIARAVNILRNDGVIIYPTGGVYAFGCSLHSIKAIERIKTIRQKRNDELTIICESLSNVAEFAKVDNRQFKMLKRNLPGQFTFILNASSRVPDKALGKRKTVAIRIPDNPIPIVLVRELGFPMVTASVKESDEVAEYTTDPELIHERYGKDVELVINGGYGETIPTTMVDLTGDEPEILRQGGGELR